MAKQVPKITEWRIIGVSGSTADGREISAQKLQEMAESYDPKIYGAIINLEHYRFLWDKWEGGYGSVLELKAEAWEKDPSKTALLAKLSVLPALQNIWDKGEKLFTSMEIQDDFADTGKAYLVGLAITDSPASLGTTENFSLASQNAEKKDTFFGSYTEAEIYRIPVKKEPIMSDKGVQNQQIHVVEVGEAESIFAKLFKKFQGEKDDKQPEKPATSEPEKQDYAAQIAALQQANADAAKLHETTINELNGLKQQFADLLNRLETETASGERTPHGGANEIGKATW